MSLRVSTGKRRGRSRGGHESDRRRLDLARESATTSLYQLEKALSEGTVGSGGFVAICEEARGFRVSCLFAARAARTLDCSSRWAPGVRRSRGQGAKPRGVISPRSSARYTQPPTACAARLSCTRLHPAGRVSCPPACLRPPTIPVHGGAEGPAQHSSCVPTLRASMARCTTDSSSVCGCSCCAGSQQSVMRCRLGPSCIPHTANCIGPRRRTSVLA